MYKKGLDLAGSSTFDLNFFTIKESFNAEKGFLFPVVTAASSLVANVLKTS